VRETKSAERRGYLPRVSQGADSSLFILGDQQHAPLGVSPVSWTKAVHRLDPQAEIGKEIDPVDPAFKERSAARDGGVSPPPAWPPVLHGIEVEKPDLTQ
jgi:hypothetical protein